MTNRTLTAVPGLRVGHATAPEGGTGCTVVLGPFRAAVEVRGLATGTRELGTLAPEHLVPRADALLFTGGSAFGLDAAAGVMAWHRERGLGYRTRAGSVPIVPAAVVYDLAEGRPTPGADLGRQACDDAGDGLVETGRVGAGAGATVGKLAGPGRASPGGVGCASSTVELPFDGGRHAGAAGPASTRRWTVAALAVVNAVGNVLDGKGRIVAGIRGEDGTFLDARAALAGGERGTDGFGRMADGAEGPVAGTNTTLAVVATDAPLSRLELLRMARMASTALARRIDPVHTPFDGDVVFAVSTAPDVGMARSSSELLEIGVAARTVLENAITESVR